MKTLMLLNIAFGIINNESTYYCYNANQILAKIPDYSKEFDHCLIFNDWHEKDDPEFKYIPPHFIKWHSDTFRLNEVLSKLKCTAEINTKNTPSAALANHNREIILDKKSDIIVLGGATGTIDIIATAIALIGLKQNVKVDPELVMDFTEDHKSNAIRYLRYLNLTL